jgi:hypothetical protein
MTLEEENVRVPIKFPYPESEQFHGEFGLDIIALVGVLRYETHHSVPEIHQELGCHLSGL